MKTLLRVALVSCLLAGLLGADVVLGGTRTAFAVGIVPQPGHVYPVGTVFRGKCGPDGWWSKFEVWAAGGWHYFEEVGDQGSQGNPSDPYYCANRFERPGHYRLVYYLDPTDIVLYAFTVSAGPVNPCTDDETEIVRVDNPSGARSDLADLKGTHLTPGQTIAADQDVELTLGDNSVIRMTAGSNMEVPAGCKFDEGTTNWKIALTLTLGKVWATITSQFGGHNDFPVSTERASLGGRYTEFWVSYDPKSQITTLHVISGSEWIRTAGVTVNVGAGQTATQRGTQPPVLQAQPVTPTPTALPAGTLLDISGTNDMDRMTPKFTVAGAFTIRSQWTVIKGIADPQFALVLHDSNDYGRNVFDPQTVSGSNTARPATDCSHGCRLEIMASGMKYHVALVKGG